MYIKVVPYNSKWPKAFAKEAALFRPFLEANLVELHHIGSTSVPGLMAKPIIDMLMEVKDHDQLDSKRVHFEKIGYEVMGEMGIPGRRYFRKGGKHRTHHIHAFVSGDSNLERHLAFRDYLIAHPDVAAEYGALKAKIALEIGHQIELYCDAKDPFIKVHEQKAVVWYRSRI